MDFKKSIPDLSFDELASYCTSVGEETFRSVQIFEWIYKKGARTFADMNNLSASLRRKLADHFSFHALNVAKRQTAKDGTAKYLFDLRDHEKIETVLIPTAKRTTVCLSTQAGCKFGCKFCASGLGGWKRNLSTAEMLSQILYVKEEAAKHKRPLSHVVCMGTGEPLDTVALRC